MNDEMNNFDINTKLALFCADHGIDISDVYTDVVDLSDILDLFGIEYQEILNIDGQEIVLVEENIVINDDVMKILNERGTDVQIARWIAFNGRFKSPREDFYLSEDGVLYVSSENEDWCTSEVEDALIERLLPKHPSRFLDCLEELGAINAQERKDKDFFVVIDDEDIVTDYNVVVLESIEDSWVKDNCVSKIFHVRSTHDGETFKALYQSCRHQGTAEYILLRIESYDPDSRNIEYY